MFAKSLFNALKVKIGYALFKDFSHIIDFKKEPFRPIIDFKKKTIAFS